jgi:hypothetical protein
MQRTNWTTFVLFTKKNGDTTNPEEIMTGALKQLTALFPHNSKTGIQY